MQKFLTKYLQIESKIHKKETISWVYLENTGPVQHSKIKRHVIHHMNRIKKMDHFNR